MGGEAGWELAQGDVDHECEEHDLELAAKETVELLMYHSIPSRLPDQVLG